MAITFDGGTVAVDTGIVSSATSGGNLTGAAGNDMVVVEVFANVQSPGTAVIVNSISTGSLNLAKVSSFSYTSGVNGNNRVTLERWAAFSVAAAGSTITVNLSGTADDLSFRGYCLIGGKTSAPFWDSGVNASGKHNNSDSNVVPSLSGFTTTYDKVMLLMMAASANNTGSPGVNTVGSVPAAYALTDTVINATNIAWLAIATENLNVTTIQSNISPNFGTAWSGWVMLGDALLDAAAVLVGGAAVQEGTPKGSIFTPGSGPTRQLRGAKAFPPTNVPIALLARTSMIAAVRAGFGGAAPLLGRSSIIGEGRAGLSGAVSLLGRATINNHTIANIGTALGALAAQVGIPQGFLFRPGTGPTWDIKRRSAFPDAIPNNNISLFARSFAAGFARATASGAVPLTAKSEAQIRATDNIAGAAPLSAKSEAMLKTTDGITGALPLSGASVVSGHFRATFSGVVPLLAKTAIASTGRTTVGLAANLVAIAGLIGAAVKARAGLTGTVPLLARLSLTPKARAGLSGSVLLSAKSAITSSGRATMTAAVALTAVAGRIGVAVKSRGVMTVTLALSATTAIATVTTSAIVAFGVHTVGRPLKNAQTRVRTIYNTLRRNS